MLMGHSSKSLPIGESCRKTAEILIGWLFKDAPNLLRNPSLLAEDTKEIWPTVVYTFEQIKLTRDPLRCMLFGLLNL